MSKPAKRRAAKGLPREAKVLLAAGTSVGGTSVAARMILVGDRFQHHYGFEVPAQAPILRKFHGGELPTGGTVDLKQQVNRDIFISMNYDDLIEHASRPSTQQPDCPIVRPQQSHSEVYKGVSHFHVTGHLSGSELCFKQVVEMFFEESAL